MCVLRVCACLLQTAAAAAHQAEIARGVAELVCACGLLHTRGCPHMLFECHCGPNYSAKPLQSQAIPSMFVSNGGCVCGDVGVVMVVEVWAVCVCDL